MFKYLSEIKTYLNTYNSFKYTMGKRKNHKNKKPRKGDANQDTIEPQPEKKLKVEFTDPSTVKTNPYLEQYYRKVLEPYFSISPDPEAEFQSFMNILRLKLPVTFRINSNILNYQCFHSKLKNPNWVSSLISQTTKEITSIKPIQSQGLSLELEEKKESPTLSKEDLLELENLKDLSFKKINWYPGEMVWELNLDKSKLKRSKLLDKVHEYLQKASDSGLITRQELVSMIPPLLLDVKSSDIVFDMCAAPGSKTAQLLELLYADESEGKGMTTGGVMANDADYVRAYMLIHQIQRICTAGMLVLNHAAQYFPALNKPDFNLNNVGKYDNRVYFDKILADVPCSGDGAIRKLPNKWVNWHTQDGMCLHLLQTQILLRGLGVLKVNGLLLYSTCSINPIEDEAVVTEVFRKCVPGCFELIDVHQMLPGFKGRKGLNYWPVWEKKASKKKSESEPEPEELKEGEVFNKYENYEEVIIGMKKNESAKAYIKPSMFPENKEYMEKIVEIEKTMRVLPHDQNTGGFYVALFRKLKPIVLQKVPLTTKEKNEMIEEKKEEKIEENEMKIEENPTLTLEDQEALKVVEKLNKEESFQEKKDAKKNTYQPDKNSKKALKVLWKALEKEEYDCISDYYGLSADFPKDQLIYLIESGPKKISLISEAIRKILDYDTKQVLNKINLGSKAFVRNKEGFSNNYCKYRICQDSIVALFPFVNKRKIVCNLEDFKFILLKKNLRHNEIQNESFRKVLMETPEGSLILYMEGEKGSKLPKDILVCQNFTKTLTIMCSKELYGSFTIKYF